MAKTITIDNEVVKVGDKVYLAQWLVDTAIVKEIVRPNKIVVVRDCYGDTILTKCRKSKAWVVNGYNREKCNIHPASWKKQAAETNERVMSSETWMCM